MYVGPGMKSDSLLEIDIQCFCDSCPSNGTIVAYISFFSWMWW